MDDSDPTILDNDETCLLISLYLYAGGEEIIPNPDISGIGVRQTIYFQSFLNHVVAMAHDTTEDVLAVNAANAVTISAFAVASGYVQQADCPHLIIYHFVLLISFSNVTYNTIPRSLRRSRKFGPLVERLTIIELFFCPLFIIITTALWLGIASGKENFQGLIATTGI